MRGPGLAALAGAALMMAAPALAIETAAAGDPSWAKAAAEVGERRARVGDVARARNVILFIGDGMGISTVTAARIFEAQKRAAAGDREGFEGGEENLLSFERFSHSALVKTYNTNAQVPDSAGTATAMTTGAKTRIGVLGMLRGQGPGDCNAGVALPRPLARLARDRGMGVGVVTTTRITHATPAAMWAHVPNRDWEGADRHYPAEARQSGCRDIADQLVRFQGGMDVVLGGGRDQFRRAGAGGMRDDGRDLVAEWRRANGRGRFVEDRRGLDALSPDGRAPVLGLFNATHMDFNFDADREREPDLAAMTRFAVRHLEARHARDGQGYVLMVEGGRIDHAHHLTNAYRALDETVEFARAIEDTLALVDPAETLILVTADHSHVFTIAGYPPRGNPILGFVRPVDGGEGRYRTDAAGHVLDMDGRPFPTLGYANGPDIGTIGARRLDSERAPDDPDYLQTKTHRLASETHGGEDVGLWAIGPGSALVSGTMEQNSIFHIIAHALGWMGAGEGRR